MENKRSTNLCSAYILPLLDLNKYSFGESDNFVNSYVNEDDTLLVVQLNRAYPMATGHNLFRFSFTRDTFTYYVFEVPNKFMITVKKFREGKYSQFQEEAKTQIRKRSGLSWRVPIQNGGVKSAKELLALDKDKELRRVLEESLSNPGSIVKLAPDAELISLPGQDNFTSLNLAKSTDLAIMQ